MSVTRRAWISPEFGQALLPYATHLNAESEIVARQLNAMRGADAGTLRIGTLGSVAVAELPGILRTLTEQHPLLQICIFQDIQDVLLDMLNKNLIDILIADDLRESDDLERIGDYLFTDKHVVIAARSHPLAAQRASPSQTFMA